MNIPVLINPKCEHLHRVEEAVDIVNHLQRYFRLSVKKVAWLPNEGKKVDAARIRKRVEKELREPAIALIQSPFKDSYFSHCSRCSSIITMADWESKFAPPPLKVYLAYEFAEALVNFAADLPEDLIESHEPPIGCFFDFCDDKKSIKLGMVGANLCGDCEVKLAGMGLADKALKSIEQILLFVRDATIRRPRTAPSNVFIGHGRSNTWLKLKAVLTEELDLQVDEFNQEATAGIATTERLQEMLDRACFAFLVMTAEDGHADKEMHARENVVHELGLFQGKLGFRKAIVLKEKGCADFSNIHGLTYISFPKGKINLAKKEICRTLEREGIIEPVLAQRALVKRSLERARTKKSIQKPSGNRS